MIEAEQQRALWRSAQEGIAEARERLLQQVLGRARACLAGRVAPHDLDELVQRAGLSVLGFLDRGGEVRDFATFTKFRALGVLSEHRKAMRTQRAQRTVAMTLEPGDGRPAPGQRLGVSELLAALEECRSRLVEGQRKVFTMRWDDGFAPADVAERLGITANAVNVRLFKAHRAIRECLGSKGFDEGDL